MYRKIKNDKEATSWLYGSVGRANSRLKLNELDSNPAASPTSEDEYTYRSPTMSERSGNNGQNPPLFKKRRSYDKVYKTHEPLDGLPETEFEEKSWDLDSVPSVEYDPSNKPDQRISDISSMSSPIYRTPYDYEKKSPVYTKPDVLYGINRSSPNLLTDSEPNSPVNRTGLRRDQLQSQSSVQTEV